MKKSYKKTSQPNKNKEKKQKDKSIKNCYYAQSLSLGGYTKKELEDQ